MYERHRAIVRIEPLLTATGTWERIGRILVSELATLGPLTRRVAGEAEVGLAAGGPLRGTAKEGLLGLRLAKRFSRITRRNSTSRE